MKANLISQIIARASKPVSRHSLKLIRCLLFLVAFCATGSRTVGQGANPLTSIVSSFDKHRKEIMQEKLFLHIDRPSYVSGETMWLKLYNLDGTLHQPLDLSKVAYVEVLDTANQPVLQAKIALREGIGHGSFVLPLTLASGNYNVRAYTSWMKNFSPDFYFEQPVTIVNTFTNLGLKPVKDTAAFALQFFPEGGHLVSGVESKVAFKAVDQKTGKGLNCEGEVVNQEGEVVARFRTLKFGMGSFLFTPADNQTYTALVKMPLRGAMLTQALPAASAHGYAVQVEDASATDLKVTVQATSQQAEPVYLLGHARQMIAVAEAGMLAGGKASFTVKKAALADGITHFTAFNALKKPVSERLYFKRPATKLEIEAKAEKSYFNTRDKVTLELLTTAGAGKATPANLSMAVYRLDQLPTVATPADISSFIWLTSDLKGTIENPAYYLTATGPEADEALDNLMLTHGWSRFRWEDVLADKTPAFAFAPEYDGHFIRGKVTHKVTDGPAPGVTAYLAAPGRHVRHYNATSSADGTIQFEVKDFFGPKEIVVQTNTLHDSSYQLQVLSPFSEQYSFTKLPAFAVSARQEQELVQRHLEVQVQQAFYEDKQHIFRTPGVDSTAFFGTPAERYLLDDYTRFKQLEEVLHEYVTAVRARKRRGDYHLTVLDRPGNTIFADNPLVLLDGVPVFDMNKAMAIDPLKLQKLEVVAEKYFHGPMVYKGIVSLSTYQGDLEGFQLDPRSLLLEYEGLQLQREFYAPAYASEPEQRSRLADQRKLLHWAPDIATGENGKATLEFSTSDQAGTYLVVLQGISKAGLAGSKIFSIEVKQPL
ncbi:hypothetical protein [Pontibacter beigongshangensis]|uniref:hypothetical protein n=1 Tax=Pontibacter beigongshangensis TaxID=2574733 RepID=UPI00164FF087|nr:hypothetical protein [Pontibacter beigongshangensis]